MALNFEYFDAAGANVADGVFIPQADLLGVEASELASGEASELKDAKVLSSILNVITGNASFFFFNYIGRKMVV